ncbi:glutathione S-transferase family protein [Anabaena sp. UHCC 0399]|uniref:glutathione S-transferase family protein n=1 Tax=Anabaena sp. UHCC 0399 TaxID=3110238 RepID=UPI002B1FC5C5|nr:glutathione S-transferase family protein [Anabaena sp. UHCC 0399]MEA5566578.1 glutathione S-transferase family protein [Anabaena sp. UHCC 0399]
MLKFYYAPLSPNARRVWITLLEKEIEFEPILMKLNGDQLQPEFLEINPFHHIPVVVDDGFRVIESLAILDYLERKYLTPALLPNDAQGLAKVRMVQMVTANELFPKIITLICDSPDSPQFLQAVEHINKVLQFLTEIIGGYTFFNGEQLTLADIVAGTVLPFLPDLGVSLNNYPQLQNWCEQINQRPAWDKTKLSDVDFEEFKRRVRFLVKLRRREINQDNQTDKTK